jgi:hypothetical protein
MHLAMHIRSLKDRDGKWFIILLSAFLFLAYLALLDTASKGAAANKPSPALKVPSFLESLFCYFPWLLCLKKLNYFLLFFF